MLTVTYDADLQSLRAVGRRRTAITGARGALNGYQKGACFYCYSPVSTGESSAGQAQVDHVFAWSIGPEVGGGPVDGVWNLVLACARCNGWHEKSDRPPHVRYIEQAPIPPQRVPHRQPAPAPSNPHCPDRIIGR